MQYSTNYNLNKPQPADQFNIEHWNENTDSLDSLLKTLEVRIAQQINDFLSHQQNASNPHAVTKAQVGLGNCDNTADANKIVASAAKLTTARKVYVKLGTASTTETKDFSGDTAIPVSGTLPVANGGTGQTSLANIKNALGLSRAVLLPDYSNSTLVLTDKKAGASVTIEANGWFFVYWKKKDTAEYIVINNVQYPLSVNDSDDNGHSLMIPVVAFTSISFPNEVSERKCYFIPFLY